MEGEKQIMAGRKIGRNDSCPCGSGKKYKKCCLEADARRAAEERDKSARENQKFVVAETDLDDLSNSVQALIESNDLDRAEAVCRELQEKFPDQVDGIWRLAAVLEARGQRSAAAQAYRQAADFMQSHPGFDRESVDDMIQSAERMEAGDDNLPL